MDLGSGTESREEEEEGEAEEVDVPSLSLPSVELPSETSVSTSGSLSLSACAGDLLVSREGGGVLSAGAFFDLEDLLRDLGGGHPTSGVVLLFFAGWFLMEPSGSESFADDEAEGAGTADEEEEDAGTADDAAEGVAAEDGVGAGAEVEGEGTAVPFFFFLPFADASVFVFITNQICNNWE